MRKIIDVTGFGHSGKTAITDYLKQYPQVFSFPNHIEFELFRVSGGLVDLYHSVYASWSLLRSKKSIEEFKKVINRIGNIKSKKNITSWWNASGHNYDEHFNGMFKIHSEIFLNKLIIDSHRQIWPYSLLSISKLNLLIRNFSRTMFGQELKAEIYYSNRNDFLQLVNEYIQSLFKEVVEQKHSHIILNNAFEAYNPTPCFEMVPQSLSIVVDRDPRDIYASMIGSSDIFVPEFEKYKGADKLKKNLSGFDDINYFILRFKLLRENISFPNDERVLRINFEDFIINHDDCANRITNFIGLDRIAIERTKEFNLENSRKNVGVWKRFADLPQIKQIESELGLYCKDYK